MEGVPAGTPDAVLAVLRAKAKKAGFSVHAIGLVQRMYEDFRFAAGQKEQFDMKNLVAALLFVFVDLNGLDFVQKDFVLELTEASLSEAEELAKKVRKTLECAPMDPRYLTEEGFVRALYMV